MPDVPPDDAVEFGTTTGTPAAPAIADCPPTPVDSQSVGHITLSSSPSHRPLPQLVRVTQSEQAIDSPSSQTPLPHTGTQSVGQCPNSEDAQKPSPQYPQSSAHDSFSFAAQ